jgi:hypothetical protein
MLAHRHFRSSLHRQCPKLKVSRCFSSTSRVTARAGSERNADGKSEGGWSARKDPAWSTWKKTVGKQFEQPHRPRNWLGGEVVEFVSVCVLI